MKTKREKIANKREKFANKRLKIKIDRVRPARIHKDKKTSFYYIKDGNRKIFLKDKKGHEISNINKNNIKIVNKIVTERVKKRKHKAKQGSTGSTLSDKNNPFRSTSNAPFSMYFPGFSNSLIKNNDQLIDIIRRLEYKNKLGYDPKYKQNINVNLQPIKDAQYTPERVKEDEPKLLEKKQKVDKLLQEREKKIKGIDDLRSKKAQQTREEKIKEIQNELEKLVRGDEKMEAYIREKKGLERYEFKYIQVNGRPNLSSMHEEKKREPRDAQASIIVDELSPLTSDEDPDQGDENEEEKLPQERARTPTVEEFKKRERGSLARIPIQDNILQHKEHLINVLTNHEIKHDKDSSVFELENLLRQNKVPVPAYWGNGKSETLNKPLYDDQIYGLLAPYKDFVGCIMRDELKTLLDDMLVKKKEKFGFIINTDDSKGLGKHWQAIYVDNTDRKEIDFYDSYGDEPSKDVREAIKAYTKHFPYMLKLKINKIGHQSYGSNLCGWHSSSFLERMFKGSDFLNATDYNHSFPEEIQRVKEMRYKKFGYI